MYTVVQFIVQQVFPLTNSPLYGILTILWYVIGYNANTENLENPVEDKHDVTGLLKTPRRKLLSNQTYSRTPGGRWSLFKRYAKQKGLIVAITKIEHGKLITLPCYYCGASLLGLTGGSLDRIDNSKGYLPGNVLPCCGFCNKFRNNYLTVAEAKFLIEQLKLFRGN